MRVLLFLLAAAALELNSAAEVNPIRRIVTLLQNMQKEVKAEGEKEEDLFNKFMCFCNSGTEGLTGDIKANDAAVKQANADAKANQAMKDQLDSELAQHKSDRSEALAAIDSATNIRNKEREEFEKAAGDSAAYLAALNQAIPAIRKGMAGTALVQLPFVSNLKRAVGASQISESERQTVTAFLSGPYGDFQASSGEIVGILENMKDQMDKDLGGLNSDEEAASKTFVELKAAKSKEIAAASGAIEKKSVRSGELAVQITTDKNNAKNALGEMSANEQFLANLKTDCDTKDKEWAARTKSRNDELLAISEAIKVLSDDDSLDIFKKTLPAPGASAFIQKIEESLRSRRVQAYAMIQQVAGASETRSTQLSLLSYLLKVGKVDFSKIIKLIDDMIVHLGNEQKDDDQHRDWCNAEFESSDDKKKDLQRDVTGLNAEIEELSETISQTNDSIAALQSKIAETDKSVAEATEQRKKENAEFQQTSVELGAASQLLEKAKNRLNKFYNPKAYVPPKQRELTEEERIAQSMGEVIPTEAPQYIAGTTIAVSLMQLGQTPETWSAGGYKSKGTKSGGVIALMDMMIKDVSVQLQEGQHDEKTAQTNYEGLMRDAAATRAQDAKSLADDKSTLADTEERKVASKGTRAARADELEETNKYISNLHGNCDFLVQNFAFRKEARSKERDALANAKAVLSGADYQ